MGLEQRREAIGVRPYAKDYKVLLRALRSRNAKQVTAELHGFLKTTNDNADARGLIRSILHALGQKRLEPRKLRVLESLLLERPDLSAWHMMGALKVTGKKPAGREQRVKSIRRLFEHRRFISPLTVRIAMAAYYDERIGHHVKGMLRQLAYLDHGPTRREIAHNLTFMLTQHEDSERLVHPYMVQLAGHEPFRQELRTIQSERKIHFLFGGRGRLRQRAVRLDENHVEKIKDVLHDAA